MIALFTPLAYCAWQNRLKLRHLASLDDRLAETLASGAIRLLDAEVLRSGALERIERRQDFEALQKAGEHLFVQPEEAVRMLKARRRQVGFLTYVRGSFVVKFSPMVGAPATSPTPTTRRFRRWPARSGARRVRTSLPSSGTALACGRAHVRRTKMRSSSKGLR